MAMVMVMMVMAMVMAMTVTRCGRREGSVCLSVCVRLHGPGLCPCGGRDLSRPPSVVAPRSVVIASSVLCGDIDEMMMAVTRCGRRAGSGGDNDDGDDHDEDYYDDVSAEFWLNFA